MSLLFKASNGQLFLSSSIASMATCSSFCAQLPIHFRPIPISSSFPTNQPFRPFSAQASISPANGIFFALLCFFFFMYNSATWAAKLYGVCVLSRQTRLNYYYVKDSESINRWLLGFSRLIHLFSNWSVCLQTWMGFENCICVEIADWDSFHDVFQVEQRESNQKH